MQLREALVSRYFPDARSRLTPLFKESGSVEPLEKKAEVLGRSSAFRRIVLEIYDFQCVACGLRIKLSEDNLTIVNGAHLIPFSVGRNDHPKNGLALCKNHHWAMDRFLIVPTIEGVGKASLG